MMRIKTVAEFEAELKEKASELLKPVTNHLNTNPHEENTMKLEHLTPDEVALMDRIMLMDPSDVPQEMWIEAFPITSNREKCIEYQLLAIERDKAETEPTKLKKFCRDHKKGITVGFNIACLATTHILRKKLIAKSGFWGWRTKNLKVFLPYVILWTAAGLAFDYYARKK